MQALLGRPVAAHQAGRAREVAPHKRLAHGQGHVAQLGQAGAHGGVAPLVRAPDAVVNVAGQACPSTVAEHEVRFQALAHPWCEVEWFDLDALSEAHQVHAPQRAGILVLLAAQDPEEGAQVAGLLGQRAPVQRVAHVGVHERQPGHAERGG
jgi:hypothetical protein